MSIGRMVDTIQVVKQTVTYDSDGFSTITDAVVCTARAETEYRHGSVQWRNRAEFSEATVKFTVRINSLIKPGMHVLHNGNRLVIESVEDVANRHMWMEILCRDVKPTEESEVPSSGQSSTATA